MLPTIVFLIIQALVFYKGVKASNATDITSPITCRTERRIDILYDHYRRDVCARCYNYLPSYAFRVKFRYVRYSLLKDPETNVTYDPNPENTSFPLARSFASDNFMSKWIDCCKSAWACCDDMVLQPPTSSDEPFCPRTWDGWQCWPDTPAGTFAKTPCLSHVYFKSEPPACPRYAVKECWPNGTWFLKDMINEWTNYSNCGAFEEHRRFLYFHIAMYSISITFLLPALVIFTVYKQLQVHRITMHKNLFASLLLNGLMVLLFKSIVIIDELHSSDSYKTVMEQNGPGCKLLFILTKYFRMTNYMWMFCEGFYLHKLIAAAFAEQKNLIMFYIIGWAFPVLPVSIYAILRRTLANEKCWALPVEMYEWIMNAPNLLSLVVNMAFLCNIIRVLVTKLRATHANEPSQYRKAVRATLVLIPLFGLHFCLVIYRPQSGECGVGEFYTYINHAMDGLQGFFVALIFCYMNGEVKYLMRRSYQRYRMNYEWERGKQTTVTMTRMSTTQVSMVNDSQVHARTSPIKNGHRTVITTAVIKEMPEEFSSSDSCPDVIDAIHDS